MTVLLTLPDFYDNFNIIFPVGDNSGIDTEAEFQALDGYTNTLHPDGVGYSYMADWWNGVLLNLFFFIFF
jgi:hypothetical protein